MPHTQLDAGSPGYYVPSAPRRLTRGLPVAVLAALAVAFGCGVDDRNVSVADGPEPPAGTGSSNEMTNVPGAGGGGQGTSNGVDTSGEATPGNIGLMTGAQPAGAGAQPPPGSGGSTAADPPVDVPAPLADQFVEDNGLDCVIGELPANIAANPRLPDPFQKLDGTPVTTQQEWRCRRKEIRAMAERYVYGTKPPRPESVTGSVTNAQITVNVSNAGRTATFSATVTLPTTGSAPYPAVFSVAGSDQAMFLSQGVAIINFTPNTVGQEVQTGGSQANRQNKTGAFYTIYGNNSPTGLLAAWAWGVSRYIDVIEASDGSIIAKDAFAVMGCSRSGKAAFAIGALDERIGLSIPFESGTAGVPLYRAVAQAEVGDNDQPSQSLSAAFTEQAWFGDAFGAFLASATTVPIDTHEIIGMFAPRGLLILDNPFIGELTARGAHAAALGGVEVYRALGVEENFSYLSNTEDGSHCRIRTEFQEPLRQAIQRHLFKNDAAAGGAIQVSQEFATANPQDWLDWLTPTLD